MSGYISGITSSYNVHLHHVPSSPRILSRGEEDPPEPFLSCRSNSSHHHYSCPPWDTESDHWKNQQCQNPRDLPRFQTHLTHSQAHQPHSGYPPPYFQRQFDYYPRSRYDHTPITSSSSPLTSSGVFSSPPHNHHPSSSSLTSSYPSPSLLPPSTHTSCNFPPSYGLEHSPSSTYRGEYSHSRRYNNYTYSGHNREDPSCKNLTSSHDWQSGSWSAPSTRYRPYSGVPSHPLSYSSSSMPSRPELPPSPGSENHPDSSPPTSVMASPRHSSYSEIMHPSPPYPTSPTSFIDIIYHPQDLGIEPGDNILLTCEARILFSSERPTYQWYKDEEPIIGEVQSCFRVQQASKEDLGYYFCVVSSTTSGAQRKSSVACVKMAHQGLKPDATCKPVLLDQPEPNVPATLGERLVLKLTVRAQPDASFQWFRNGVELPCADSSELVIPCVMLRDEGQYICSIKNDLGTILSETFTVHLSRRKDSLERSGSFGNHSNSEPKISLPPSYLPSALPTAAAWAPTSPTKSAKCQNSVSDEVIQLVTSQICRQISPSGNLEGVILSLGISQSETNSIRAKFSGLANQVKELIYLWCKKNAPHCNAVMLENSLQMYGFRVSIPSLSSNLRTEALSFKTDPSLPPSILRHPDSIQIHPGETVDMVIETEGSNLSYQWYKDGHPYPGQTKPRILITDAQEPSKGLYYCCVNNSYGCAKSHPARVDIIPLKLKLPPSLQGSHYFPSSHEPTPAALFSPPPDLIPRRGSGDTSSLDSLSQQMSSFTSSVSERLENLRMEENDHKPVILEHPVSQTLAIGDMLHLNIVCRGTDRLKYSWYFNGLAMRSEKQNEFILYCFTEDDVGDYSCEVSNEYGSVMSGKAVVALKADDEDEEHT